MSLPIASIQRGSKYNVDFITLSNTEAITFITFTGAALSHGEILSDGKAKNYFEMTSLELLSVNLY